MKYIFKTSSALRPYCVNYWIDKDVVPDISVEANDIKQALQKFKEIVNDKTIVTISEHALKEKAPIFIDDGNGDQKQVGYVITGKVKLDSGEKYVVKYITLWVEIIIATIPNFHD